MVETGRLFDSQQQIDQELYDLITFNKISFVRLNILTSPQFANAFNQGNTVFFINYVVRSMYPTMHGRK